MNRLRPLVASFALLALVALLLASCAANSNEATGAISSPAVGTTATPELTVTAPQTSTATATPARTTETTPTSEDTPEPQVTPTPGVTPTQAATPEVTATSAAAESPTATPLPTATPTLAPVGMDIRATRLQIPVLGVDAVVRPSQEIPDTSPMPPGCPAKPPGQTTLTVPPQGIATPEQTFAGLERKSWIYGHSRWLGEPGLFSGLQSLNLGDELILDGVDRESGSSVTGRTFVVDGLFLADTVSGGSLVTAEQPTATSQVILQTSVRERGEGKAWILDRETLLQKSVNVVEGDLEDPCKYLLLFVVASAS